MKTTLTILSALIWSLPLCLSAPPHLAVVAKKKVPVGITYLIDEDCEGTGTPSPWVVGTATVNFDETSIVLSGSQSVLVSGTGANTYADFTGQTTVWCYALIRWNNFGSGLRYAMEILDSGGTRLAGLSYTTSPSGEIKLTSSGTSAASSTTLVASTIYEVWLSYTSGGTATLAIAPVGTGDKPTVDGSGNVYLTQTAATGTATRLRLFNQFSVKRFDNIKVSATEIPSNP